MNPRRLSPLLCAALITGLAGNVLRANDADLSHETNWFPRVSPSTKTLWGVTHGDGRFVAVGEKGTILTSEGGGMWNTVATPFTGDLYCVRYVNGLFVAGTTNGLLVSEDAQQWVYRAIPVPSMGSDEEPVRFSDVAYGLGHYVAVAKSYYPANGTSILTSPDGLTWTERYMAASSGQSDTYFPNPNWKSGLVFADGRFVEVGHTASSLPGEHRFLTSTNALTWTPTGPSYSSLSWLAYQSQVVTYGNGLLMAAGYVGSGPFAGSLYRSTNGTAWNVLGGFVHQGNYSGMAYGSGRFVALGSSVLRVSTNNGATWSGNYTEGPSISWYPTLGVCYGAGTFVGVGYNGTIIQSAVVEETPPFFITTPTNQVVHRGATATLRSRAGGSEPLGYQWYKGGLALLNATNATLLLSNVQPVDAGSYTIVVSSPYGSITMHSAVSLTVIFINIASYAGLTIEGIPGRTYRVEYLNALESSPQWDTLTNFVLPTSPFIWIDYETPAVHHRFYRASELP